MPLVPIVELIAKIARNPFLGAESTVRPTAVPKCRSELAMQEKQRLGQMIEHKKVG